MDDVEDDDFNVGEASQTVTQNTPEIINIGEEKAEEETNDANDATAKYVKHGIKLLAEAKKGKTAGQQIYHYDWNYCRKLFIGPGSGTFLEHVRKIHPKKCPELLVVKN